MSLLAETRSIEEYIAKQYVAEVWDADELVAVVLEVRDTDYLKKLVAAAAKA